jgi:hypothetical protein
MHAAGERGKWTISCNNSCMSDHPFSRFRVWCLRGHGDVPLCRHILYPRPLSIHLPSFARGDVVMAAREPSLDLDEGNNEQRTREGRPRCSFVAVPEANPGPECLPMHRHCDSRLRRIESATNDDEHEVGMCSVYQWKSMGRYLFPFFILVKQSCEKNNVPIGPCVLPIDTGQGGHCLL